MKRLIACSSLLLAATALFSQAPPPRQQASPAETATGTVGSATITVKYNAPAVRGREGKIFGPGGLIQSTHKEYPVWRAGANAATTLVTSADIKIGGLAVPAGSYTLFVDISNPDQWTLIVSKKVGEWGLAYDASQDLGRIKMTMSKPASMVENLAYEVSGSGKTGKLTLSWEDHAASVSISAK